MAKHRQIESCASCHELIDPPGFALESFDVIGGWRDYYRSVGRGEPVTIEGRQMHYYRGLPVDSADRWHDGRTFTNVDELKQLLLTDKEQLARAFLNRLLTYATGCAPRPSDQAEIQSIIDKIRIKNYGLRTMIHELTRSSLFQSK